MTNTNPNVHNPALGLVNKPVQKTQPMQMAKVSMQAEGKGNTSGYSVTVSPNGQMTVTQGGRVVYRGSNQGVSLTYNQSGQLVGFNAPKSSPITTTQPSASAQSWPLWL